MLKNKILDQNKNLAPENSDKINVVVQIIVFFMACMAISVLIFSLTPEMSSSINFPFSLSKAEDDILTWVVKRSITSSVSIVSIIVVSILCIKFFTQRSSKSLGYLPHKGFLKDFLLGCLISFLMVSLVALFQWVFGGTQFVVGTSHRTFLGLLMTFGLISIAAFEEEILFRGYPIQALAFNLSPTLATIITSSLFGLLHLGNPNVTFFSTANTILAGVWLSVAYFKTRSLFFATGLHLAWNFTMGVIYGLPVSGITKFANYSFLDTKDLGKTWLTGSDYGPEGGATATIVLILGILLLTKLPLLKISPEMKLHFPNDSKKSLSKD